MLSKCAFLCSIEDMVTLHKTVAIVLSVKPIPSLRTLDDMCVSIAVLLASINSAFLFRMFSHTHQYIYNAIDTKELPYLMITHWTTIWALNAHNMDDWYHSPTKSVQNDTNVRSVNPASHKPGGIHTYSSSSIVGDSKHINCIGHEHRLFTLQPRICVSMLQ